MRNTLQPNKIMQHGYILLICLPLLTTLSLLGLSTSANMLLSIKANDNFQQKQQLKAISQIIIEEIRHDADNLTIDQFNKKYLVVGSLDNVQQPTAEKTQVALNNPLSVSDNTIKTHVRIWTINLSQQNLTAQSSTAMQHHPVTIYKVKIDVSNTSNNQSLALIATLQK